jgi:hypothetical protein
MNLIQKLIAAWYGRRLDTAFYRVRDLKNKFIRKQLTFTSTEKNEEWGRVQDAEIRYEYLLQ